MLKEYVTKGIGFIVILHLFRGCRFCLQLIHDIVPSLNKFGSANAINIFGMNSYRLLHSQNFICTQILQVYNPLTDEKPEYLQLSPHKTILQTTNN